MTTRTPRIEAGQVWRFKRSHTAERADYGDTATVVRVSEGVDRPHPGFIVHTLIDLDTARGIELRGWSPGQLRASATLETNNRA